MNPFYDQYGEIFYINTVNVDMTDLHEIFLEDIPEGGRILDAGCGSGRDAFAFKQKGYEVEAMDASPKMAFLSSHLLEQKVHCMTFLELQFAQPFDGIWACASLLHVPTPEMPQVLKRLSDALRADGILYATFKYGTSEEARHERFFNDFDEVKFAQLHCEQYGLIQTKMWKTQDRREEREDEFWLNVMLTKKQF